MPISTTRLVSGVGNTNGTVYTTPSISPGAGKLIVLSTVATGSSSPTVTGCGLTWTHVTTGGYAGLFDTFVATGTPAAGAVTITYPAMVSHCGFVIDEIAGADVTGGALATILQPTFVNVGPSATITINFAAFASVANGTYLVADAWGDSADDPCRTWAVDVDFASLGQVCATAAVGQPARGTSMALVSQWAASNQLGATDTVGTSSYDLLIQGFEVKAAPPPSMSGRSGFIATVTPPAADLDATSGFSVGAGGASVGCVSVSAEEWRDATLRFTVTGGVGGATGIIIDVREQTGGGGCAQPTVNSPIHYVISHLDANETITIDGERRDVVLVSNTGVQSSGLSRMEVAGLFHWPDVAPCETACICMKTTAGVARIVVEQIDREI